MTTANTTRRDGFTLIELLVVISIIIVLGAVSAGAYFRIKAAQAVTATETNIGKLNSNLRQNWEIVVKQAGDDVRDEKLPEVRALITLLNGNKELAKVLWTYIRLRLDFPTTFREAQSPITVGSFTAQPKRIFMPPALPAFASVPAVPSEEQSAACLFLALTATGRSGNTVGLEGLNNQAADLNLTGAPAGTTPVKVFNDSWGKPLAFCRIGFNAMELDTAEYTKANVYRDPFDPTGQIPKYAALSAANQASVNAIWAQLNQYHMTVGGVTPVEYSAYVGADRPPLIPPRPTRHWYPTIISGNSDRTFDAGLGTGNDIVSYRLSREGTKGN